MKPPDRQCHRLAQFILQQIQSRDRIDPEQLRGHVPDIRETFNRLSAAAGRHAICASNGWRTAARVQTEEIAQLSRELVSRASELQAKAHTNNDSEPVILREIFADLLQLSEEFDKVDIDFEGRRISVEIEPVTLKDIYLGPFQVQLHLSALSRPSREGTYKVIALDPHPASSNDAVTHPHVRDEELCEGDARAGILAALRAGRLSDFFILVRSVLQTYNPGSPYVALGDWEGGITCHDCGYVAGEDSSRYCDGCNYDFCDDCMSYCRQCDDSRCRGCLENCSACDEPTCSGCGNTCKGCKSFVCDGCLEDQLCPACREKEEEDGTDEDTTDVASPRHLVATGGCGPRRQRRRNRHRNIAA
jgi:hypothetical protein